jgi:uncharacterized protein YgiM (DUF1202 family)
MARFFRFGLLLIGLALLLLTPTTRSVVAQDDNCPTQVILAMARAGSACRDLEPDQACAGNGTVNASFQPNLGDLTFGAPGERVPVNALAYIQTVNASEAWSVALMQIRADLPATEQRSVTLLAFGDVTLENNVPPLPELTVSARAVMYIRATPNERGEILREMGLRETLTANGRTEDNVWVRVLIPGTSDLGWVSTGVITAERTIGSLAVVDETTPFYYPFQIVTLHTGQDDAWCAEAPASGLLIQTPNTETEVTITINGITLHLAATVFLQGDQMDVLDGYAEIEAGETTVFVPAGTSAHLTAQAAAEPYDPVRVAVLPVNNLPYRFALPDPLTAEQITALTTEHFAQPEPPLTVEQIEFSTPCTRRVRQNVNLWAGPGMYYEVVSSLNAGSRVQPVLQVQDSTGQDWWQLRTTAWIPAYQVESTGNCGPIPIAEYAPPPTTNHMVMETCTTTNGPLRPDQAVTFEFVPPGYPTVEEAIQAPRVDRGRVTVGNERLWVQASGPIQVAEERFLVTYTATWTAVPGSYRVVADRLTYELLCNITVPLGH